MDDQLRSNEEPYGGTFSQLMDIACVTVAEEEQSQTAALFEAACNEKIQQFDDSESDEEVSLHTCTCNTVCMHLLYMYSCVCVCLSVCIYIYLYIYIDIYIYRYILY